MLINYAGDKPGVAIGIIKEGKHIIQKRFGIADLKLHKVNLSKIRNSSQVNDALCGDLQTL